MTKDGKKGFRRQHLPFSYSRQGSEGREKEEGEKEKVLGKGKREEGPLEAGSCHYLYPFPWGKGGRKKKKLRKGEGVKCAITLQGEFSLVDEVTGRRKKKGDEWEKGRAQIHTENYARLASQKKREVKSALYSGSAYVGYCLLGGGGEKEKKKRRREREKMVGAKIPALLATGCDWPVRKEKKEGRGKEEE